MPGHLGSGYEQLRNQLEASPNQEAVVNSPAKPQALLTPQQVAALLQIPQTTLAVWRSTGRVKLRFVKVGRAVRYLAADVDAFIEHQLQPA